jgi:hypothetical protein
MASRLRFHHIPIPTQEYPYAAEGNTFYLLWTCFAYRTTSCYYFLEAAAATFSEDNFLLLPNAQRHGPQNILVSQ